MTAISAAAMMGVDKAENGRYGSLMVVAT